MFKVIKDNKIVGVAENEPVLLDNYEVQEDNEHSVADYIQINGEYVLTSSDEAIEQRKEQIRSVRNQYLEQTDKYMIADYPITDDERELYKQYRVYLRDYTLSENWWEHSPMTFEEWKSLQTTNNNDGSLE